MMKLVFSTFLIVFCCFSVLAQTSKTVKANGIKTHYLEWGTGPETIVLLYSLSDTAEVLKNFAPLLAKNYRIIAPDRRGAGQSSKPVTGYEMNNLAQDVGKLIDSLKLGKVYLVGHSVGGSIAMTIAANYSGKIKKLVLLEGGFWQKKKPQVLSPCPTPIDTDCLISKAIMKSLGDYDADLLYSKILAPTLLVMGVPPEFASLNSADNNDPNKQAFDGAVAYAKTVSGTKLKNGKLILIKDARHWVFNDQSPATAKELLSFLKQ
jgi:pimeloyl-ACP methyl ester carboxylesterase